MIIVSGAIGEETAIESLKAGATDYVLKQRLDRLGPVIDRALRETQEINEREQAEKEIIQAKEEWSAPSHRSGLDSNPELRAPDCPCEPGDGGPPGCEARASYRIAVL